MVNAMSLAVLREMFDYNCWARDCQLRACSLTEEQFLLGNSSLRGGQPTHLLAVEWL